MIGAILATVREIRDGLALMIAGGVGYEVHVNEDNWNDDPLKTFLDGYPFPAVYWIHEHAPQDQPHELYGFREREQRDLFRRLLKIKGVGPKVAMRIVASGGVEFHCNIPACNCGGTSPVCRKPEVARLCKIRGVGATLAQRIAEELT